MIIHTHDVSYLDLSTVKCTVRELMDCIVLNDNITLLRYSRHITGDHSIKKLDHYNNIASPSV